jgi:hypothetical protein
MPIHRRARLGLGYLPQETSIFRKLNVQDNVRAVLELQRDAQGKGGRCGGGDSRGQQGKAHPGVLGSGVLPRLPQPPAGG